MAEQLLTTDTLFTIGGATAAVIAATTVLHQVWGAPPKKSAFFASMLLAYSSMLIDTQWQLSTLILSFFNGCLLFLNSTGSNELFAELMRSSSQGFARARPIITSWMAKAS